MIYVSAGHYKPTATRKGDPGAVSNGFNEADLTIIQRDLTLSELSKLGIAYEKDTNTETLSEYLKRVGKQSNNSDVCLEYHFDAAAPTATGSTAIIPDKCSQLTKDMARELVDITAKTLGLKNRGIITEVESHRGKLGFMRLPGITVILELAFITNRSDLTKWEVGREKIARLHAQILKEYEYAR